MKITVNPTPTTDALQHSKGNQAFLIAFLSVFIAVCLLFGFIGQRLASKKILASMQNNTSQSPPISATVIIDAGHGGEDAGTVSANGTLEKDLNLLVAQSLEKMLTVSGVNVIMTRNEDILLYDKNSDYLGHKKQQDLTTRLKIAQAYPDACFVSIHMNSFSVSKYNGLQVYYSPNNEASYKLANTVQSHVRENLQPYNTRKIKQGDKNIYLLDRITSPAVLVECGFLSNEAECARLCDEEYRKKLCFLLCASIMEFISQNTPESLNYY
ncbi:MAG: N-acetylmuramoyl-L-alanine amidase [Clostridia bacterium]|nr:N-acetylmuramoyl-L-alanine amidase [Clostridia bacterium]